MVTSNGTGAMLVQSKVPVGVHCRKMTAPETKYANHKQELLAVIIALKLFRCDLLGNYFTSVADNMPNTQTLSQHCQEGKLVGADICNISTLLGCTGLAEQMLQIF